MRDHNSPSPTVGDSLLWTYERTVRELGGLSERHIYRLVDQGELTRVRIGKRSFIVASSVHDYVARKAAAC